MTTFERLQQIRKLAKLEHELRLAIEDRMAPFVERVAQSTWARAYRPCECSSSNLSMLAVETVGYTYFEWSCPEHGNHGFNVLDAQIEVM